MRKLTEALDVIEAVGKSPTSASQPLNDLLVAIKEINGICEDTAELSGVHTYEEAMNCDQALTDILHICEEVLKKNREGN